MKSVWASGSDFRAWSRVVVLPGSVSTSRHPARDNIARNPIGREMRLDRQIDATGLEDREDGGQPIQIALGDHRHNTFTRPAREPTTPEPAGWHGR